jgi:hypothetical protein
VSVLTVRWWHKSIVRLAGNDRQRTRLSTAMKILKAALLCGALTSCVELDETTAVHLDDDPCWPDCGGGGTTSTVVTNVKVSGREVFDDWRDYGRFTLRSTPSGTEAKHWSKVPAGTQNLVGLFDATVEVFEIDRNFDATETDCVATKSVGSTTVAADGSWSITIPSISDSCTSDDDLTGKVRIGVKTKLSFCDSVRCFNIVDFRTGTTNADMTVWQLWHPTASKTSPLSVATNQTVSLATMTFQDTTAYHDLTDERERAATAFAAIVDISRKFHVQNAWDFDVAGHGALYVRLPTTGGGQTLDAATIELGTDSDFKGGWVPLHEYGHVLDVRLIDGFAKVWKTDLKSPCDDANCDSWSRDGEYEWGSKAFSEGIADFFAHFAVDTVTTASGAPTSLLAGCSTPTFDNNASTFNNGAVDHWGQAFIFDCTASNCTSAGYPTNVARALCDWYDATNDNDAARTGSGDTMTTTIEDLRDIIHTGYIDTGVTELEREEGGFGMCDLARSFVGNGGSQTAMTDLLLNNGITCNL